MADASLDLYPAAQSRSQSRAQGRTRRAAQSRVEPVIAAATAQPFTHCMEDAPMDGDEPGEPKYMVSAAIRKKYGRYPPWCRLNVDQVPLPFVNDMDITYEQKGAKRVVINQLGPALSQRQCTGQLCFRPAVPPPAGCTSSEARRLYDEYLQSQPAPCIIFRGQARL